MSRLISKIQERSLYVLLFLLPFSKAAIEIMFGVLLIGWGLARLSRRPSSETIWKSAQLRPLAVAAGSFLAVCALSIVVSDHPRLSLEGFVEKWVEYLLLFIIAAELASTPNVVHRSLTVIAWSSVFVIIEALTQEVIGKGVFRGHPFHAYGRVSGPYENPIDLATYLMVLIPILLAFGLTLPTLRRRVLSGLVLLLVVVFIKTEAFGAWVGLVLALALLAIWQPSFRRAAFILMGVFIAGGACFLWWRGTLQAVASLSEVGKVDRWVMWQAAIGMIRDRPLLGHGVNTFMANYLTYWVGGEQAPRYAHNCYLQVAAETGLVGLGVFVGFLWLIFAHAWRGLRRLPSDERLILLGIMTGLFAFILQAGVDTNFYALRQAALFWTLSGLAVGFAHRGVSRDGTSAPSRSS